MRTDKFERKVAIVTGAAQGIGKAISVLFVSQAIEVVLCDINFEAVQATAELFGSTGFQVDVTDSMAVKELVTQTMDKYKRIDILVNNAGILFPSRFENISKEEWDKVLDVNVNGVFNFTKAVIGIMKSQQFGRIVNISSSAGRSVSTLGGAHYTTSKAAVLGLTRAVAKEMAPHGITVNAVCPGLIDTEMVRMDCKPEAIGKYESIIPIPRLGTPEEVAKLVSFLIFNADYITGASIDINGGDLMI
ncbi:SDR family oxidoreductase [bacterium]|nr:SDR family oxidoreductase [bacterium]